MGSANGVKFIGANAIRPPGWEGNFSGAMLNLRWVSDIQIFRTNYCIIRVFVGFFFGSLPRRTQSSGTWGSQKKWHRLRVIVFTQRSLECHVWAIKCHSHYFLSPVFFGVFQFGPQQILCFLSKNQPPPFRGLKPTTNLWVSTVRPLPFFTQHKIYIQIEVLAATPQVGNSVGKNQRWKIWNFKKMTSFESCIVIYDSCLDSLSCIYTRNV